MVYSETSINAVHTSDGQCMQFLPVDYIVVKIRVGNDADCFKNLIFYTGYINDVYHVHKLLSYPLKILQSHDTSTDQTGN